MFLSLRMHARHWSNPLGRCFFHCGCMPGTGAVRWGDISFRTSPRRPIEPPILTHRTRDQQTGGTGVMGTEGHGRGRGAGGRQHGQNKHTRPKPHPIGGHRVACGAWPRCRRAAAWPEQAHAPQAPPDWRPPRGLRGQGAVPVGGGGAQPGFEPTRPATHSNTAPPVWRAPEGPEGQAAVPVGGGRARAGLEIDHSEPQARVWRSRGRAAAHRHTQRPGPSRQASGARKSGGARNTSGTQRAPPQEKETPTAPGTP